MEEDFEIIIGQRGGELLTYENHLYNKDSNKDGTIRWRCHNRSCKGVLFVNDGNVITKTVGHSHNKVQAKIQKLKIMAEIKERLKTTSESAFDIITKKIPELSNGENISQMPSVEYLRDTIRRSRNSIIGFLPGGLADIPQVLQVDSKGNRFLRYDSSAEDNERYIIFFTEYKRKIIPSIKTFVVDGTFKSAPQGFYQLVVFHGYIFDKTFPFIYILLSSKSENLYLRAFNKCQELVNMNVKNIVTDFERALVNALNISFPEAECNGCLFHLGQATYRRVGALGDIEKFKNDSNYNIAFKKMLRLAFVPINDVSIFYEDIKKFISDNKIDGIRNFQHYFEKNYLEINDEGRGVCSIAFWNAFSRVEKEIPRTSNNAESWNRTLNKRMETSKPNIALFITRILDCEELDIFNLKRYKMGVFETRKKNKSEDIIRMIVKNYNQYTPENFMKILLKYINFKLD
jgi:hypothetical protein